MKHKIRFVGGALSKSLKPKTTRKTADRSEWQKWYDLKRWKVLRERMLVRDGYQCQQTGVLLTGKSPAPNSPVVDHIEPHKGDVDLFWDEANLQSVSKAYHDSQKQALDAAGSASLYPDWIEPSLPFVTLVCGAPCSGKNHYVSQHAKAGDVVIDLDEIGSRISGEPYHGWSFDRWGAMAIRERNKRIAALARNKAASSAWIISGEPYARRRAWWMEKLGNASSVVLETPERICLERLRAQPERNQQDLSAAIALWWARYDRRIGEKKIK